MLRRKGRYVVARAKKGEENGGATGSRRSRRTAASREKQDSTMRRSA